MVYHANSSAIRTFSSRSIKARTVMKKQKAQTTLIVWAFSILVGNFISRESIVKSTVNYTNINSSHYF
ncbi:hypothetical protein VCRA2113O118_260035 [Vibrio crassostreae]|nr:hypothetical protein VCRA2110O113_240035 [Vibrio crassostreae]CAK1922778.1 hypothetical protein VCRA2114E123_250035 [Vibrio crassostreae]CAK1934956.1 hypothetical protein VCRA2114E122_260035 [Vibrio crassostreae]CAK1944929.1 hypothetical protein VCRA2113O120_280035 [Vibrio crassostreae]CAK1961698.1 hypothetical protein VCRA2113O119_290018 [Vibrio crassostreae]